MIIVKYPYYKANITHYKSENESSQYITSFEEITKDKWEEKKKSDFLDEIKKYRKFKETSKMITNFFEIEKSQSDYSIERFAHRLIDESIQKIDEKKIFELGHLFISDIKKGPKNWHPTIWLNGLIMNTDQIKVSNHICMRKTRSTDWEFVTPKYNQPIFMSSHVPQTMPDAIIESQYNETNAGAVQKQIQAVLLTLRLYKTGSITAIRYKLNPESILELSGTHQSLNLGSIYKYEINKEDEQEIQKFFNVIMPIVEKFTTLKKTKKEAYIQIAIERYNTALEEQRPESRITYATMCLEALYLSNKTELTRRLSQRVACMLSFLGEDPLSVFTLLKKAYKIRSSFVHGSLLKQKDKKNIKKLEKNLLRYTRKSLVLFLQIHRKIKKNEIQKKIDNSLIDEKEKNKFKKSIDKNCRIF